MKSFVVTLVLFLNVYAVYGKARIPIPYGTEEKIIKIVDLPDTEDFKLEDGSYFDIGSMYTKSHLLWLSYSNSDPKIVGFVEGADMYLDLNAEQLAEIEKISGKTIPKTGSISFFDKFLGKGILGLLVLLVIYGIYSSFFGKEEEEETVVEEEKEA